LTKSAVIKKVRDTASHYIWTWNFTDVQEKAEPCSNLN